MTCRNNEALWHELTMTVIPPSQKRNTHSSQASRLCYDGDTDYSRPSK